MFAVIRSGGKQYRVQKDDVIQVEKLDRPAGQSLDIADVVMVGEGDKVAIGTPLVSGALVTAEVVDQTRAPKIKVFKKKRRQNYRRKKGHRQALTVLKITDIQASLG
ncbi:MAG: 50S ribosomal protein L21 [Pseudomonadota bacterium]